MSHPPVFRYDHICKLWDIRQLRCLASVDHGAPIESVAFFPSGASREFFTSVNRFVTDRGVRTCALGVCFEFCMLGEALLNQPAFDSLTYRLSARDCGWHRRLHLVNAGQWTAGPAHYCTPKDSHMRAGCTTGGR